MSTLMYVKASPRGERSHSLAVADAFLEAYAKRNPKLAVLERNVFEMDLPSFDGLTIRGKYNIMNGRDFTPEEEKAWKAVETAIADFSRPDIYLFAVPMWNFQVPYRLKQLIDVVTQPGYTFSASEAGYQGLLENKKAFVAYARGGQYPAGTPAEGYNHQSPYFEAWLAFVGITEVTTVAAEGMLSPQREANRKKAEEEARRLAASF